MKELHLKDKKEESGTQGKRDLKHWKSLPFLKIYLVPHKLIILVSQV